MLTMKRVPLSISLLCAWLLSSADCSHFRGGSMSWKPTSNASQIEISHQMAWRRSSSSSSFCNDATIATQGTLTVSAYLYCRVGCNSSSRISLMHGKCIAYSASEDWSLGEDSFIFNVPIPGIKYTFRLEDCCWQSIRNRGSSDSMRMTMTADLRPRADTGVMNSSPVATMSPIVRLLAGCQHSFRIPVIDADNDIVRCRLPNTTFNTNECGYLCAGLPGSALDTDACVFSYNATSGTGIYGVSLYIEDFSAASPSVVLSSVPIQFLILVFSDSLACNDGPTFVSPTPPEASCHVVNTTFTTRLVARTKSAAHTITKIFLMGPTGITKSNLAPYGKSGREWSISVKWSPTQSQDGLHLVCFSAEINNKLSSGMMCFDVMKGTPPSINLRPNCLTPTGEIDSTTSNITFRMCFDKKFNRPTRNKYMIIHHSNGTEANRLNLNDPSVASFSTLDDRMVTVTWGNSSGPDLLGSGQYYIILEAGSVAAQPLSCISDWPGMTQPFYWNFTVVDRTPPSLNFVFNPTQVSDNETFSMTWTVSESLSMERCNLTTPTSSSLVNCRSYISQNNLVAGNYSIKIELEDLNGNKAGPYEHQWLVVDRTPPSLTFASNPTQVNENETFSMTWTVSESLSMERCNLTTPTSSSIVNCRGSFNQIFLDPGNYSISIELEDVNGNKAEPYEHQWIVIDRTPPSLTFVSNPTQVNDNETFSMTWTVSESLSMEHCNLTTPASSSIVNCRGSYSQNILIPGNYAISIKIEDLNGNKAGPYEHIWVVIDVTPPSLRFVLNHSLTRSNASITWTVSEPVVSSNCTVTFPNGTLVYESCIDRWEAIDLRRGPYQISIVLVDTAGHIGGPFRHTWTNIDVTPPILTFTRKPTLSLSKANITWVTNEEADGVCEVQGPSSFYRSVVCDKVWSEDYLPEGEFILNVTVYDQSLNMAGPFQHKWYNRDVKPPELRLTSSPFRDKSYDNATLTWTYNEYAASTCVIKTSLTTEFAPCDNSWSGTFLPEGNVTIEIDARDKSRNSAPTYKYTWYNKDTTPPVLTFIRKEALTVNHAWITWSVNEPASANCTLTTPLTTAVFSCDSGLWSGFGLLGGSYGLGIRLLDRGNNAAGPFVHKWLNVDTIRPRVTFTRIPSKTYSNATVQWNVSEPVNGSCEIRGPANFYRNVTCNGNWVGVNLPPGSFTLGVTLIDTSGNVGGPSRHQWINDDVTPPSLRWIGSPPTLTNGSISLSWTTDEAVTSLCTVNSPVKDKNESCNNEWVGTDLRNGEYTLTVKMVDGSGNKAQTIHYWNNTIQDLVFELILTLSNVIVTNVANKTSPEYNILEAESQTSLENFYRSRIGNFKSLNIKNITVESMPVRRKRRTIPTRSELVIYHDVVLGGNSMSKSTASLSKAWSTFFTGGSSLTIGGSTTKFAKLVLMLEGGTTNITFIGRIKACDIAQSYVTCRVGEQCDESTAMCVAKKRMRPDNDGLILSVALGVSALVVLLLGIIIIGLFYLRKKEEQRTRQKFKQEPKKRFETPIATIRSPSQTIYRPYNNWHCDRERCK